MPPTTTHVAAKIGSLNHGGAVKDRILTGLPPPPCYRHPGSVDPSVRDCTQPDFYTGLTRRIRQRGFPIPQRCYWDCIMRYPVSPRLRLKGAPANVCEGLPRCERLPAEAVRNPAMMLLQVACFTERKVCTRPTFTNAGLPRCKRGSETLLPRCRSCKWLTPSHKVCRCPPHHMASTSFLRWNAAVANFTSSS